MKLMWVLIDDFDMANGWVRSMRKMVMGILMKQMMKVRQRLTRNWGRDIEDSWGNIDETNDGVDKERPVRQIIVLMIKQLMWKRTRRSMEKKGEGSMLMMNSWCDNVLVMDQLLKHGQDDWWSSWCKYLEVAGDEETFDIVGMVDSGII